MVLTLTTTKMELLVRKQGLASILSVCVHVRLYMVITHVQCVPEAGAEMKTCQKTREELEQQLRSAAHQRGSC